MIMITMKVTKITTTKHVNGKMFSVSRLFMKRNFMDALVKTLILLHAYRVVENIHKISGQVTSKET